MSKTASKPLVKVLLVEDDADVAQSITFALRPEKIETQWIENGSSLFETLDKGGIDLILLDWMLPQRSGIEILGSLKRNKRYEKLPVILLTAKDDETSIVNALHLGADDYVVKPARIKQLAARIHSVLRRSGLGGKRVVELGDWVLDEASCQFLIGGQKIKLAPKEIKMIALLMNSPNRLFSRRQILNQVWGNQVMVDERTVDVHIRRLRKHIKTTSSQCFIETIHKEGYLLNTTTLSQK